MRDLAELLEPYKPPRAPPVDVAALRMRLRMSQLTFTRTFGFPLTTLRHWEQRTRRPSGAALVLLHVIQHHPGIVRLTLMRVRNRRYHLPAAPDDPRTRRTGRRFHLRAWLGRL
jgi:DNA-binding transcriptional regulator YiaG